MSTMSDIFTIVVTNYFQNMYEACDFVIYITREIPIGARKGAVQRNSQPVRVVMCERRGKYFKFTCLIRL